MLPSSLIIAIKVYNSLLRSYQDIATYSLSQLQLLVCFALCYPSLQYIIFHSLHNNFRPHRNPFLSLIPCFIVNIRIFALTNLIKHNHCQNQFFLKQMGCQYQYYYKQGMILNKLMVTPFSSSTGQKQLQPTLRILNYNKKMHSKVNEMQNSSIQKQPLNFDDTICFASLHKIPSKNDKKHKQLKSKKCVSQVLTIKQVYQNPNVSKEEERTSSHFRGVNSTRPSEMFNQSSWEGDLEKGKFNRTSQSTRKYSVNKQNQEYIQSERPLTRGQSIKKKSTFMKSKFPYSLERFSNNLQNPTFKSHEKATITFTELSERREEVKGKAKKSIFQYNIIKPEQIKQISLKRRQQQAQNYVTRKKQYRQMYQQMLRQMRRKEETARRNNIMRERMLKQQQLIQSSKRFNTCCAVFNNLPVHPDYKTQLKPWDVEGSGLQASNFDIL